MIQNSGKVYEAIDKAAIQEWLDSGEEIPYGTYYKRFEEELAKKVEMKKAFFVNSGSSANLLAFAIFASPNMYSEWRVRPGDEIITVAASFPTTISPIIQYGAVPVFVDIGIPDYNIDVSQLERALSAKTKGVFIAHTLGNPFDIDAVISFCVKHGLFLITDGCDAFGSLYKGRSALSYGHVVTTSFYPAHHFSTGNGGAVFTNDSLMIKLLTSIRQWGRSCTCPAGHDGVCGKRYTQQHGELPYGYDHKYVYSEMGYNLMSTNPQAALGLAQLKRIDEFTKQRHKNYIQLQLGLARMRDVILPVRTDKSDPSWFGFPILLDHVDRRKVVESLYAKGVASRLLFAGNITKQPCLSMGDHSFRTIGDLPNTDRVMNNLFWIGCWHGLSYDDIETEIKAVREAINEAT